MTITRCMRGLLFAASAAFLFSCQKEVARTPLTTLDDPGQSLMKSAKADPSNKYNTFNGPEVQMGDGMARSWVVLSHTGVPQELGIELTAGALSGLPPASEDMAQGMYVLPLHQKAQAATPFDHIVINWEAQGHPPMPYMVPHFDFHFYMISPEAQMAIPEYTPGSAFDVLPPASALPPTYIPIPGGVPMMGKHWADVTSPELQDPSSPLYHPFTETFIYGSYDGKVIFYEPMVALSFLQGVGSVTTPIAQPGYFAQAGYYPTVYKVYRDAATQKLYISLGGFAWKG